MKLSQTLKKAFIASVMQDVPKVDYLEQAQKCARKHFERLMPKSFYKRSQNTRTGLAIIASIHRAVCPCSIQKALNVIGTC